MIDTPAAIKGLKTSCNGPGIRGSRDFFKKNIPLGPDVPKPPRSANTYHHYSTLAFSTQLILKISFYGFPWNWWWHHHWLWRVTQCVSEISVSARPVYLSFRVKTRRVCFHPKLCILWPNPHSSPCTHSFQSFSLLLLPIFASFAEHQEGGGGGVGGGGVSICWLWKSRFCLCLF